MILYITLICLTQVVWAQNIDYYHVPSMEEIQLTKHLPVGSLFGFSTAYDKINSRMIISAPRENMIGEVYACDMTKAHNCSILENSVRRLEQVKQYDHHYWFGATVEAASSFVVACAPGYTDKDGIVATMNGRCYTLNLATHAKKFKKVLLPNYESDSNAMDTLGWSLAIGSDDSVIVGGPAMYNNYTGAAAIWPKKTKDTKLQLIEEMKDVEFNFGYSVAVGNFLGEDKLYYAVGSTYGNKGYGQVLFYSFIKDKLERSILLSKGIDDDVVGSMFGAVLCAVKINKVGHDLLVGAPGYASESGYNEGAVYVYIYTEQNSLPRFRRRITNHKVGSYFGNAIISVGDINNDGRDEVAIAAPFEDGRGVVYLYCGASLLGGTSEKILQRLESKYHSFGLSLTALPDHDDNGCNELAVSSPYEDRVQLYNCWASITITNVYTRLPNIRNRSLTGQTDFTFDVCMDIKYPAKPKRIEATISTTVEMTHPHATLIDPNDGSKFTFTTPLTKDKTRYCGPVKFRLPKGKDYTNKINYDISLKLQDSPAASKPFNKNRVILSDLNKLSYTGTILAAECKKEKCEPNLSLKITTNIPDPFNTGSSEKGIFNITVKNAGEMAYDPCVQFHITGAPVYQPPMGCSKVSLLDDTWECTVRKSIWTNDTWDIDNIIVNLKSLTNKDKIIKFNTTVYNQCSDRTSKGKTAEKEIHLKTSEKFDVSGKTNLGELVSLTTNQALYDGKKLEHMYTIINKGLTTFVDMKVRVTLQRNDSIKYLKVPVSYFRYSKGLEEHKECKVVSKLRTELKVQCLIDSLAGQDYAKIVIPIEILPSTDLAETLQTQNIALNSSIILEADLDLYKTMRVSTLIQLIEVSVPLWIFILAGLLGLIIILCLVYGLFRCGFLRRNNKQKLDDLKARVHRQSTRRSQMHQSEDQRAILKETIDLEDVSESSAPAPCMYSQRSSVAE